MFYGRFVDDTLIVIKPEDLNRVHNTLSNFDRNLKFTLDTFNDVDPHSLDIEIHLDGLEIYCKPTNTGQYTHYTIFSTWRYKTAWITNIIHRATVICDETKWIGSTLIAYSCELEYNIDKRGIAHKTEETKFKKWFKSIERASITN